MKKLLFIVLCLSMAFSFQTCKEDDQVDETWKKENEDAFNQVAANSSYIPKTVPGGPGTVYCKILQSGIGTVKPIYTSQVKVNYVGSYYDGTVFDESLEGMPSKFSTNAVVSGFTVALQNMVIGDKWEVWVPWYLGYGSTERNSIPAYSTLVFQIELVDINQYP